MRAVNRRGTMAALTVGLVVTMTGCSAPVTGDSLYREAEKHYVEYSTIMHSVIMAIHEGEWAVNHGSFGAAPVACQINSTDRGYAFVWDRLLEPESLDVDAVIAQATDAFADAGLDVQTTRFGEGDREEINVMASGPGLERGAITIRPARNQIAATATHGCFEGDAIEVVDLVFGGEVYRDASLRYPAVEGPDWQPRFYFPEEGSPVYTNSDGTPIDPRPDQSELPVAPYGD